MSEFFVHDPYGFPCHKVYHRRDRIYQNHGSHGRHLNRVRLFQHLFSDCTISFNPCNVFFIGGKTSHNAGISAIFRYVNMSGSKLTAFLQSTYFISAQDSEVTLELVDEGKEHIKREKRRRQRLAESVSRRRDFANRYGDLESNSRGKLFPILPILHSNS